MSCNRPRASTGTEGHALDPRITPSRTACAVLEITGLFKLGDAAVVAASAIAADKPVLITIPMGARCLGVSIKRSAGSVQLNAACYAISAFLLRSSSGRLMLGSHPR